MKRRIFTAVNLPDDIKFKLVDYQNEIEQSFDSPGTVRWTKKENLHITLDFFGYLTDEETVKICQKTRADAGKTRAFTVTLDKIVYGPPDKMPPRMIWVTGEKMKGFNIAPHITLGRIKAWEFRKIDPETRPRVDQEINLSFEVKSIEVMESILKRGWPSYTILESINLKL